MNDRYGKEGYQYHKSPHFWKAIQKYGWDNFSHIVLIDNLTKEEANILETALIKKFNTTNREYGYNFTLGGEGTRLAEVKQYSKFGDYLKTYESIMEASNDTGIPELTIRSSCANKGAFLTRDKYRWVYEGEELVELSTLHTRNKEINQYDKDGKFLKQWESALEVENSLGYNHSKIAACCRLRQKTAYGYIWRYNFGDYNDIQITDDYYKCKSRKPKTNTKKVVQLDFNLNMIKVWKSASEASRELFNSDDTSSICRCCKEKLNTAHGFKWMYYEDYKENIIT